MRAPLASLGLIVKCTRHCNLLCRYCLDRKDHGENRLSLTNLARLFQQIGQGTDLEYVHIIWHGGEPLTRGVDFFDKALSLQRRLVAPETSVRHSIQTNGVLLTDDWARFFKANKFSVGVSLDGPREIHDFQRPRRRSGGSYDGAMRAIEVLRCHGLPFGTLTVATEPLIEYGADGLWEFFQANSIDSFSVLSLRGHHQDPVDELAYNRKYGDFMKKLLERWLREDDATIRVREFKGKLGRFFGQEGELCKDGGRCVGKYLGVEPDGSIYHCDKFSSDFRWRLGSLEEGSLFDLFNKSGFCELQEHEVACRSRCRSCKWYHLCGGGCLSEGIALASIGGQFGTNDCLQYAMYDALGSFLARSEVVLSAALEQLA